MVAQPTLSVSPSIDPAEARWAADELAALIRQAGPESVVGLVLKQAQRELRSLVGAAEPAQLVGPVRLRVAA
ncbi:MAG: hypothetical protein U0871_12500 [Gemmataceae bacterium]